MNPLLPLNDLPYVQGSAFVDPAGRVLFRQMPPAFASDEPIIQAATRLQGIFAAAATVVPGAQTALLKFAAAFLVVQATAEGILLVFCTRAASVSTLRAAIQVVLPQISAALRPPVMAAGGLFAAPPAIAVPGLSDVRPLMTPPVAPAPPVAPPPPPAPAAAPPVKKPPQKTRTGIWG